MRVLQRKVPKHVAHRVAELGEHDLQYEVGAAAEGTFVVAVLDKRHSRGGGSEHVVVDLHDHHRSKTAAEYRGRAGHLVLLAAGVVEFGPFRWATTLQRLMKVVDTVPSTVLADDTVARMV